MRKRSRYRFKSKYRQIFVLAIAFAFLFAACSKIINSDRNLTNKPKLEPAELNIWWEQGYNLNEDEALRTIVNNWRSQTNNRVKLSFFTNDELTGKTERAVEANQSPDLIMSLKGDRILYPRLAWENRLEDVADIIEPIKDAYTDNILRAITYSNPRAGKRSYYGVPVHQTTIFIFYWQQLLASVGLNPNDIPQDWDDFWQFWQDAKTSLKIQQNKDIYASGLTLAEDKRADDTHYFFEHVLEAYNVSLFRAQGELAIALQEVRQGIIRCLNWYARLFKQGYIPPDAVEWSNTDNNISLLNRLVLMTPNATLSIPATVRQDPDTYYNRLGIVGFPNKPNGQPMNYISSVRQAVIFKDSPRKSLAKEFLRYFIQPEVSIEYLKATNSRNQPVHKSVWSDPFWRDTKDPYIATVTKILTGEQTRLSYVVDHPAYSQVLAENVWGKALTQVTIEGISAEQAADEAISRIQEIFGEWDRELTVNN